MSRLWSAAAPLFVYCLGLLCLASCDILIGKWYPDHDVATWAVIRSVIAIGGVFCITGFDQLLMRERDASRQLLILLAIQTPILATFFAMIVRWIGVLGSVSSFVLASAGSALSIALSSYFRSHHMNMKSQISQQWWKVSTFIIIIVSYLCNFSANVDYVIVISMISSLFLLFILPFYSLRKSQAKNVNTGYLYSSGFRAMAMAIIMNISMFGENLFVGLLSSPSETASYFIHFSYFCLPMSVISGYLAFYLATFIRDNSDKYFTFISNYRLEVSILCVVLLSGSMAVGALGWRLVVGADRSIDWLLAAALAVNSLMRMCYVGPAQYVALFFSNNKYDRVIFSHLSSLVMSLIFMLVSIYIFNIDILYSVIFSSIANNMFRLFYTHLETVRYRRSLILEYS